MASVATPHRALVTEAAAGLLRTLQDRHGALMFHQSGGWCDGSSPLCYPDGDFLVGGELRTVTGVVGENSAAELGLLHTFRDWFAHFGSDDVS